MGVGYPDTLNSFTSPLYKKVPASTIKTKTTQELKSKNGKETESFTSSAVSQEINNPNNVSTNRLKYKPWLENEDNKVYIEKLQTILKPYMDLEINSYNKLLNYE